MSFFGANTSLGATSTPAKPGGLFGSSFGAPAQNAAAAPAFGTPAPAFGTTPSAFGAPTTTSVAAPIGTGFGGFGATATPGQTSLFGNPVTSTAPPAFSGFGQNTVVSSTPASGFAGFGSTTTTAPTFGGFGATQSAFGTTPFGSTFGKPPATTVTPGFGGFGNTNFMMGQQQQQPVPISSDEAFAQAILNVSIFGDERDTIVAKWNYLQALWGTGKLFYSQSAAPVDITQENYLCRFKAIGYITMPGKDNKMGLVALNFDKELAAVKPQQQQVVQTLHSLFGSKPNLLVHIDTLKELDNKKCQMIIYVEEKQTHAPNESKRILSTDVANYLNQGNVKQQLTNIGVSEVLSLVVSDEDQLKDYLENPPPGVDPRLWSQAKLENPDPKKYIPVPMIGFNDLKWRVKCQEHEAETHALYIKKVEGELTELRQRYAAVNAKILEHKGKLAELGHRILRIMVKQEYTRKVGTSLSPEEEMLRTKLQNLQAIVSAPTQFRGRLSELLSQMRMKRNQFSAIGSTEYILDKEAENDMKAFLNMQQRAMEVLSETINKDLKSLDIIMQGLPELRRASTNSH
ncbi:probable nucleoporin Nup54 [Scaptodrosophila lebanonensis]|uniref:Probable nucleoporin Nup54 n=1 Tax=Drosophila lebanonensis TaxID=7225 RepID=A0A6J2U0C5_DROLE|nr:probable nucleoporin Nup54 [Scaptodrosophila lebanonensis]